MVVSFSFHCVRCILTSPLPLGESISQKQPCESAGGGREVEREMRKSKENARTKGGIKATIPHHSSIPLKQEYPLQHHAPPDSFKDKICTLFWLWVPCSSTHPPSFTLHSAHSGRRWRNKSRHQSGLASLSCCCVSSEPANWREKQRTQVVDTCTLAHRCTPVQGDYAPLPADVGTSSVAPSTGVLPCLCQAVFLASSVPLT